MKVHILPTLLLATGLLFGSPVLRAEGDKPAGPKPESNQPAGGDGSSDSKRQHMEEMRKKFDTNGDGKLDDTEKAAMREAMKNDPQFQKRREEMIKKFDTNGDGQLDDTEKAAMEAAMKAKFGEGKGGAKGGELKDKMLARFDKNGDGQLDEAEKAEAKKEMEQHKAQQGQPGQGQPGAPNKPPGS